jgi:hypothetical protein
MESIEIRTESIIKALDAMIWTFNPYLDYIYDPENSIHDYPWIVELISSYNELVSFLPLEMKYEYKLIEF